MNDTVDDSRLEDRSSEDTTEYGAVPDEPTMFSELSITDILKQEVQELADSKSVFIPVKGYGRTNLQVQYRLPEKGKELDDIARKVGREVKDTYTRNITTAVDTMIHLCLGIYVNPDNAYPDPVMLDPQDTGVALTFSDPELSDVLGMEVEPGQRITARSMVRRMFGNNDMAIMNHAEKLSRWMANTKADISAEVWQLGE